MDTVQERGNTNDEPLPSSP